MNIIVCSNCKNAIGCELLDNIKRIIRSSMLSVYIRNDRIDLFIDLYANLCTEYEEKGEEKRQLNMEKTEL